MKRKIISIILIIAVSLPMFRINTVKSSAVDPTIITDLLRAIGLVTAGAVAGGAAMGLGDCLAEVIDGGLDTWYNETLPNKVTTAANNALNGNGIIVVNTSTGYYVTVDDSLSGDDLEYATILADKLNSHYDLDFLINNIANVTGGITGYSLNQTSYEELKTIIGQATSEFTQKKAIEHAKENGLTLLDNGALPLYNFDFVGPLQPGLEMATIAATAKEFVLDGLKLTKQTQRNSVTKEYLISIGFTNWWAAASEIPYKSCGVYAIYDNDIYFGSVWRESDSNGKMLIPEFQLGSGQLKRADGLSLYDVTGLTSVPNDVYEGVYFTNDYSIGEYPTINNPVNADEIDFSVSITPGSVEIPRTEGEQAVTDGINLNLISSNPELVLDENGNIVRIDGIDTSKLMELLQTIANNGSISFDSIEQYLQAITAMLSASNADAKTLNTVITNLNELTKAQNASIEEINANIASIAQALTAEKAANLDFELPEASIFDKFPFSLPWDFYRLVSLLCTKEKEPVFTIPIKTNLNFFSLDYDVDEEIILDLTCFKMNGVDVVQVFTNTTSYLFFIVCLIFATKKLIWK